MTSQPIDINPAIFGKSEYQFSVTTMQRTYNSVIDKAHFARVRKNWNDFTSILDAWKWSLAEHKWVNVTEQTKANNW